MKDDAPTLPLALQGRYQLEGLLGTGAFGAVYRVRDLQLQRPAALKLLAGQLAPTALERFAREASLLAELRHPGIVEVFDFGGLDETPYLLMELLEGRSLDDAPPDDPLATVLEVAEALEVVHAAGVLHRDIKPANLMRTADGRTLLTDFGLASAEDRHTLTKTGAVVGTPGYLPPEAWTGALCGPASDWYALGATYFELAEGRLPRNAVVLALAAEGVELPPLPFERLTPGSPGVLVAEALLDPNPSRRPSSRRALERIVEGARRASKERRPPRPSHSSPEGRQSGSSRRSARAKREEAGTPGRGRRPLVAALFVAGFVAGGLGLDHLEEAPAAAASTASPAPVVGPSSEALRQTMLAALAPLADPHRNAAGGFGLGRRDDIPADHIEESVRAFLDPRLTSRWQRFFDSVPPWLERATPSEVEATLRAQVLPALTHLSWDHALAHNRLHSIQSTVGPSTLPPPAEPFDQEAARGRLEELDKLFRQSLARLDPYLDQDAVLVLATHLLGPVKDARRYPYHQRLRRRLAEVGRPSERALLASASRFVDSHPISDGAPYTCEERGEVLDRMTVLVHDPEVMAQLDSATQAMVKCLAAYRSYFYHQACSRELAAVDLQEFQEIVDHALAASREHPGPPAVLFEMLLTYYYGGGFLTTRFGPGFSAQIRRIETAVARIDTELRGEPRGWPPGRRPSPLGTILAEDPLE